MTQTLKDEVRGRICKAALRVFAERGYAPATMASIARVAGVSTGNLYVYFENKDALFREVVPESFARELTTRMTRQVRALGRTVDPRKLEADATWHVLTAELLDFAIQSRERVIIVLGRGGGTIHERFAQRTVARLIRLATEYLASVRPGADVPLTFRFTLRVIYQNFISGLVSALIAHEDEGAIRQAVRQLTAYHRGGLQNLFETEVP
jgi:AcrR family transcriptional regulator